MKNLKSFQFILAILALSTITFTACNKDYIEMPEITSEYGGFSEFAFSRSECPQDDVILTSQSEVDSFAQLYSNCSVIIGDLKIQEGVNEEITTLEPLGFLMEIAGDLDVDGTGIFQLTGLHNISEIGSNITIKNNENLTALNLDPGDCCQTIYLNGTLSIVNNPQLNTCAIERICEFINNGGQAIISNNAPGCNNVNQIKSECAITMDCGTFVPRTWATNILSHKAKINWDPVNNADLYKVRYRKRTLPTLGRSSKLLIFLKRFSTSSKIQTTNTSTNITAQVVGLAGVSLVSLRPILNSKKTIQ